MARRQRGRLRLPAEAPAGLHRRPLAGDRAARRRTRSSTDGTLARALPVEPGRISRRPRRSRSTAIRPTSPRASARRRARRRSGTRATCRIGESGRSTSSPTWDGPFQTLGDILEPASDVPAAYFVAPDELPTLGVPQGRQARAALPQGSGHAVLLRRGADPLPRPDRPAGAHDPDRRRRRTPSRFKHIIAVEDGRFRRLTPRELERLNGFPDDWTATGMAEAGAPS